MTIGSGVREIYGNAFAECSELTNVYCLAENVPTTASDAFQDSYIEYSTLYVPEASISSYREVEPWKNFKSIVKIGEPKYTLVYMVDGKEYKKYELEEGEMIIPPDFGGFNIPLRSSLLES